MAKAAGVQKRRTRDLDCGSPPAAPRGNGKSLGIPVPVNIGADRAIVACCRARHRDDAAVAALVERSGARDLLRPKPPAINFARQERLHMIAAILVGPARGTI